MTAQLNSLFRAISPLWEMSLTAAYAAAVVALLRLILKKRAPRQVLCVLWLVVFARLLIPVSLESPVSIVPDAQQVQLAQERLAGLGQDAPAQKPAQKPAQNPAQTEAPGVTANPISQGNAAHDPALSAPGGTLSPAAPAAPREEAPAGFPWQALIAGVWLAGALAMGGYGLLSYAGLRRRLFDAIRAQDGAWEHPAVGSPFILGVVRPRIYLPAGLRGMPRQFILCHERAHLRRGDHIVKPLCWLALAIHWFNPAVWLAFILMSRDIEAACDEAVIRRLGPKVKADYSATLLSLATGGRLPAPCPLAFDEGDAKGRIKNVLRYRRPALWIVVVSVLAAVLAAVCLLTDPVSAEPPEDGGPDPDASASQSQPPEQGLNALLDPWMVEVLDGERSFRAGSEEYRIDQLRAMVYGDEFPELILKAGKLTVMDLDKDGVNELVVWPAGGDEDTPEIGYTVGYFIFRRQGDTVYGYNPGSRLCNTLKADGTFSWAGSSYYWGFGSARFTENGFEIENITWCDATGDGEQYFVNGLKATQEEFNAATGWGEQNRKPEPIWYVYEDGQLKYATIRVPIPLEGYAQTAPVPDFLDADQQLLYRQAYAMYDHIFGANTEEVDSWPGGGGYQGGDAVNGYVPATGLYRNWNDFQEAVLSVFTQGFWDARNSFRDGQPTYTNIDGQLHYIPAARGGTGNNTNFPETFRLVERTESSIAFVTTAYYTEHPGDVPPEGWDAYLQAHWDYSQDFPIRMVKTERGWRFDEFYCPMTDYKSGRLSAHTLQPRRPGSLDADPGPRALTQEELDYFGDYFNIDNGLSPNIRAMLLVSEYDDPRDIDLYRTFYHGFRYSYDISQAEREALGWNGYYSEVKVTTEEMNEALVTYLGLTLEQTRRVGLDSFSYLPEYDAYYANHSDWEGDVFTMRAGRILADGAIELTYDGINTWPIGAARVVVLEQAGQGSGPLYYRVRSNLLAEGQDEPEPSPEPSPEPTPTVCEHGLDNVRYDFSGGYLVMRCELDDASYPLPSITRGNWRDGIAEDFDGDGRVEQSFFREDRTALIVDMADGALITSTFDPGALFADFDQGRTYEMAEDNSVMTVSYQGQTVQVPLVPNPNLASYPEVLAYRPETRWIFRGSYFDMAAPVELGRVFPDNVTLYVHWSVRYTGSGLQADPGSFWFELISN